MELTNVANATDTYNFSHHAYEPYPTPLSIIESERSRICPSDVPVDLFIVRQPSPQVSYTNLIKLSYLCIVLGSMTYFVKGFRVQTINY